MSEIFIRPLVSEDLTAAAAILAVMNPETPLAMISSRLASLIEDHSHYHLFGAFAAGEMLGVAGAWLATKIWCGRYLEIDNLVVSPEARSRGVGTRLIAHLETLALESGCNVITLDSYTSNQPSHRLYHRLGFEIWGFHFIKPMGDWKGSNPC